MLSKCYDNRLLLQSLHLLFEPRLHLLHFRSQGLVSPLISFSYFYSINCLAEKLCPAYCTCSKYWGRLISESVLGKRRMGRLLSFFYSRTIVRRHPLWCQNREREWGFYTLRRNVALLRCSGEWFDNDLYPSQLHCTFCYLIRHFGWW